jgi:hypothetical protein
MGIATAVACFCAVFGPLGVAVAAYEGAGQAAGVVRRVFLKPVVAGAIAGLLAVGVGWGLRAMAAPMLLSYAVEGMALVAVYCGLAWYLMREEIGGLAARFPPLASRFMPVRARGAHA